MGDEKNYSETEHKEDPEVDEKEEHEKNEVAKSLGMSQEMYDAIYGENRPSLWAKGHLKLYYCCAILYLLSSMSGYDGSLMSGINVMEDYQKYYGMESAGSGTGLVFSISSIASIVAAFFVWVADYIGRKRTITMGIIGTIAGICVVSTAKTIEAFIGGRFLLFFSSAIAYVSIPLYLVEISPPNIRGTLAGLFNTFNFCGGTVATLAAYGAYINYRGSVLSFRIPLWCQMVCPGLSLVGIYFCPESPRWLLAHGKKEQAVKILTDFHANGIENHPIVETQIAEMTAELEASPIDSFKEYFNLWDLINTPSKRYRMFLACSWSWFGNFTGSQVVSYYLPNMLASLGIEDIPTTLLLNAIYTIANWVFATIGACLHDSVGRRRMMLISTAGIVLCFTCISVASSIFQKNPDNSSASVASIFFIYLFGCIFAMTYTSLQPIYPAEVLTTQMRAKGMAFYQCLFNVSGFILAYNGSIAMEKMKFWFYVFFVFWNSFTFVIIYFFFVETKGRTLEELEEVFQSKNPRKASYIVKERHIINNEP